MTRGFHYSGSRNSGATLNSQTCNSPSMQPSSRPSKSPVVSFTLTTYDSSDGSTTYTEILKPIYEGKNGVVYKGLTRLKSAIALKHWKHIPEMSDIEYVKAVKAEFENIRLCSHKNIIQVLDMVRLDYSLEVNLEGAKGEDIQSQISKDDQKSDFEYIIIYPFYNHGDLLNYLSQLRRNKVTLTNDMKDLIFKQILKGVSYLHLLNIAHRDLKPENFLIDDTGVVKIADFGYSLNLSSILAENLFINYQEICCGTNSFKAPELFEYESQLVEHGINNPEYIETLVQSINFKALDCWSLGVVYLNISLMFVPWTSAQKDVSSYYKFQLNYPKTEKANEKLLKAFDSPLLLQTLSNENPALAVFKKLTYDSRKYILRLLNPSPQERPTPQEVLTSKWLSQVYIKPNELTDILKGVK